MLTDAQRGQLLMALYDYAERICREDVPLLQAAEDAKLDSAAQAAFLFMASTIRRDTEKWRSRKASYHRNAKGGREGRDTPASGREDLSWMKQYIDQRDRKKPEQS